MQPAVQSFLRRSAVRRGPPWMKMSPPGRTPIARARAMSMAFG